MFDYKKLRGRIIEKYGTLGKFAEAIGRTQSSLSMILNCERYLKQVEIVQWATLLDIPPVEIGDFFYNRSSRNGTEN